VQGGGGAGRGGGEGWEAGAEAVVVEEGGELRVGLDGAFVLEVADLEIEAFDLSVEQKGGFVAQADFFFLDGLRFFEIRHGYVAVVLLFGVCLPGAVVLEELLDTVVAGCDYVAAFLDHSIFGLDLLEEMLDFRWEVCNYIS